MPRTLLPYLLYAAGFASMLPGCGSGGAGSPDTGPGEGDSGPAGRDASLDGRVTEAGDGGHHAADGATTQKDGGPPPPADGGPSSVTALQLVNQGGPNNNTNNNDHALSNYQVISWTAATAGDNPIRHYAIYRNGSAYDTQDEPTTFSGYIAGSTLTVSSVTSGTVLPGVRYTATGLAPGTFINAAQSTGTPGGPGTYVVNRSQTLGSAGSPVTFSAWVYIDSNAPNSNSPTWTAPCTAYDYDVVAVDTHGNTGPVSAQYSVYGYQDGFSNWNDLDFSYGTFTEDYASTDGNPQGGPYDISFYSPAGGFQPTATAMQAPVWDLEIGAFRYFTIDINPGTTHIGDTTLIGFVSRLPPGDVFGWHTLMDLFSYGPAPVANTWATYKVPLTEGGLGISTFTGSISGTTLTVSAVLTNTTVGVDAGGFVTGPGVPDGTYVTAYAQKASVGTFTIAGTGISGSTSIPSETMTFQRTSLYKFGIQPNDGDPAPTMYFNNFGFTRN